VEVDGQVFSSKVEAMKKLKRGPRYIEKNGKPLPGPPLKGGKNRQAEKEEYIHLQRTQEVLVR